MKNAKEKVKTTVKEKANDKTGNVKDRAASIGSYATDEEAVSGETVTDLSGNETDGRAEQDMQTLFPYDRKQFATAGICLDGREKTENFIYYLYAKICEMLTGSEGMPQGAVVRACCPVCPDNRVLAYGEPVVNAFFYDYMQKPDDYKNFRQMIKGYVVAQSYYFGFLKQQMADGSMNRDYVHQHVLRAAVNGSWGSDLSLTANEQQHETYSIAVADNWQASALSFVVFAYNADGVAQVTNTSVSN
jgi:hypothetical protein